MTVYYTDIYAGGMDCETCGWNSTYIDVDYDSVDGAWGFKERYGCYGGSGFEGGSKGDVLRALDEALKSERWASAKSNILDLRTQICNDDFEVWDKEN